MLCKDLLIYFSLMIVISVRAVWFVLEELLPSRSKKNIVFFSFFYSSQTQVLLQSLQRSGYLSSNVKVGFWIFPLQRTNRMPKDIHVDPQKFAAELISRLEGVLREREAQEKLEERLKRVRQVHSPDTVHAAHYTLHTTPLSFSSSFSYS